MAKIRDVQATADTGRVLVDEQLQELEARLTDLYARTSKEAKKDLDAFLGKYADKDREMRLRMKNGDITESEYIDWRNRTIFRTEAMIAKVNDLTQKMLHTDREAMSMVNDKLPQVYATSYNFGGYRGEVFAEAAGFDYTQFTIVNADAVRVLATKDPDLIPWKPDVDVEEDKKWNRQKIQSAIATGVVKGDSMPEIAARLLPVVNMDKNAAIRTARTAVTGIENKGRKDATERVKAAGIPMVESWSCTHDNRTRDTHILMDKTLPNEEGKYGEGIIDGDLLEYPGDPNGEPSEVYNCRCAIVSSIEGIDHSKDDELYAAMMEEEYYDDWVKVKEKQEEKEAEFQEKRAGAAERVAAKQSENEVKPVEDKLKDLGVKSITADDIDLDRLNFTDGRFGKYAYELGEEMQENSDDNLILELTTKGKYQDHIAYASIDEESASLEGIVSDGGGAGTELLGRVMEYQESKGEGLMWLADNPESVSYYEHLGLGEYGKGDKNEKLYEISAEEMSNALEKVNEHRDIPKEYPDEIERVTEWGIRESDFIPATSIQDAEKYAKDNYVEGGFYTFTKNDVSFKNIDLDVANAINQRLTTIYDNFNIQPLTSLESYGKKDKKLYSGHGDAPMTTSNFGNIGLNNTLIKSMDDIENYRTEGQKAFEFVIENIDSLSGKQRELAETYREAGRQLVDDSIEGMITHEVGHHISYGDANKEFAGINKNTEWEEYARGLSGYANASFGEYVAESFTAYFNGEYDLLQPEMKELFDSMRKRE